MKYLLILLPQAMLIFIGYIFIKQNNTSVFSVFVFLMNILLCIIITGTLYEIFFRKKKKKLKYIILSLNIVLIILIFIFTLSMTYSGITEDPVWSEAKTAISVINERLEKYRQTHNNDLSVLEQKIANKKSLLVEIGMNKTALSELQYFDSACFRIIITKNTNGEYEYTIICDAAFNVNGGMSKKATTEGFITFNSETGWNYDN